jgi:hypothetical protein
MRAFGLLLAVTVTACTPEDFPTETLVDRLRMLGITASPPDLAPGESTRLSALVLDPRRAGPTTTFWIGCDPDPFNQNRSACTDPAVVNDPARLGDMMSLPPGVRFIGLNSNVSYAAPRGLFDLLARDDPQRIQGTVGTFITILIAEEVSPTAPMEELAALFARVQRREVASLISLFRVRISEDPERNQNPQVSRLVVDGADWPTGARLMMKPGKDVVLDVDAPDAAFEPFTAVTPSGPEARTERILVAWYSTAGRFSESRTAMREQVKTTLTAPGLKTFDPIPERRTGTLWTVLRDTRGALTWSEFPFFVCDETLPTPSVTKVTAPTDRSSPVVVEGQNLGSVLDVIVGGVALTRGRADAAGTTWTGDLPMSISAGPREVVVHSRRCERLEVPSVSVP